MSTKANKRFAPIEFDSNLHVVWNDGGFYLVSIEELDKNQCKKLGKILTRFNMPDGISQNEVDTQTVKHKLNHNELKQLGRESK